MTLETATTNRRQPVGRFSVQIEVVNHKDVIAAQLGVLPPEQIRRSRLAGVVDTGATRLGLPAAVVTTLGLPEEGKIEVRFADGRRDEKTVVGEAQLEIQGRSSVFRAIVEPGRGDALVGAFVLEDLDFV